MRAYTQLSTLALPLPTSVARLDLASSFRKSSDLPCFAAVLDRHLSGNSGGGSGGGGADGAAAAAATASPRLRAMSSINALGPSAAAGALYSASLSSSAAAAAAGATQQQQQQQQQSPMPLSPWSFDDIVLMLRQAHAVWLRRNNNNLNSADDLLQPPSSSASGGGGGGVGSDVTDSAALRALQRFVRDSRSDEDRAEEEKDEEADAIVDDGTYVWTDLRRSPFQTQTFFPRVSCTCARARVCVCVCVFVRPRACFVEQRFSWNIV